MSYRTPTTAAPDPTPVWDHDARVLAGLLRSAPLTVLLSPPGVDTTPMLLHGVMPKLRRRASDRAPAAPALSGTVIAFADRRDARAGLLARRDREIAVFFDAWDGDPRAGLLRQVQQAVDAPWMPTIAEDTTVAGMLADLQARHDLRFLLLLDRFEDALAQRASAPRVGEFIEQWLDALARPDLAAHFLVALPEDALGTFEGVRERIPDFDDRVLRANGAGRLFGLSSVATSVPADVLAAVAEAARTPPDPPPAATDDSAFLASLNDIGLRVAAAAQGAAATAAPAAWSPASQPTVERRDPDPLFAPPPSAGPHAAPAVAPDAGAAMPPPTSRAPSAAWLIVPLLAAVAWWWFDRDQPARPVESRPPALAQAPADTQPPVDPTPTTTAPATTTARGTTTAPESSLLGAAALDIAVDPANGTDQRVARELTASLAPAGGIELPALPSRGGLATLVDLAAASTSPRLAIANYDALQAARGVTPRPKLAIVTPLYLQEIYFVVRADSPLRSLHDLRGARIDAGPADGSRSLTTAAVYGRLFDQPLPATASTAHDEDDALAELLAFHTVDVVATVGGQPLPWLANLPKATRDRIRLLRLDPRDPVDRRALQTFLPSTVHGLALGGSGADTPTLAVMSFLVTNARPDDVAASARLTDFALGLCDALPTLAQHGHPKWKEVRLGQTLPAGFESSAAATSGFDDCRSLREALAPVPAPSPAPVRAAPHAISDRRAHAEASRRHHFTRNSP